VATRVYREPDAVVLDRAGSIANARRLLDAIFASHLNHAPALAELAHLYMVEGDFRSAHEVATRGVQSDPTLADAHHVLAIVLVCLSLLPQALRCAREALRLCPGEPEFYLIAMAEAFVALAQYNDAVSVLNRILARRPGWLMAQALLVISHMSLGQHDDAHKIVQAIVQRNSRFTVSRCR
jgi:tetratricopeptide (TPR) repeat protein